MAAVLPLQRRRAAAACRLGWVDAAADAGAVLQPRCRQAAAARLGRLHMLACYE